MWECMGATVKIIVLVQIMQKLAAKRIQETVLVFEEKQEKIARKTVLVDGLEQDADFHVCASIILHVIQWMVPVTVHIRDTLESTVKKHVMTESMD